MVSINVRPVTPPPSQLYELKGRALVEGIKEWFYENFEDPVHNTPYESREGGYQYIWGGPYETRDILGDYFEDLPAAILEEVVRELEDSTSEWTVSENRVYDEDPPEPTPYDAIQSSLDSLEESLAQVKPVSSAIGGNKPPEEIGVPPYTDEDRREVLRAIQVLRRPEGELIHRKAEVELAAAQFTKLGAKLYGFLKDQAGKFSDAFSSELGKRAAQGIVAIGTWHLLAGHLMQAYEAVKDWLQLMSSLNF